MNHDTTTNAFLPWASFLRRVPIVEPARPLVLSGLFVLALVPVSLAGILLDPRTLDYGYTGAQSVWLKPLKFQLAVSLHLLTVGLCMAALAEARRADRTMRILVAVLIACSVFEIAYITSRGGAFGLQVHFASDLIGVVFHYLMGLGAVIITVVTAVIGIRVLRGGTAGVPPHLHLAVGLGLVIGGVAGLVTGATIGEAGGPIIAATGVSGLPLFGWSAVGGDLRVAHFFGLHAIQALPLAALAIGARGPLEGRSAVGITALFWSGLILFTYFQAIAGEPFLAIPFTLA